MSKTSFGNPELCKALSSFAIPDQPQPFQMKHTEAVKEFCQTLQLAHSLSGTRKVKYG